MLEFYGVKVRFDGPPDDPDDGEEWSHYTMAGTLLFWFSADDEAHVSVEGGIEIPPKKVKERNDTEVGQHHVEEG
jgi:hypothetical protein